jgi:hypothetical protein
MAILPSFNVKDVGELMKKGATVEAQEKIIELRQAALEFQEENLRLREQVHALQKQLELRNLAWDGRLYWLELPDPSDASTEDPTNGPFCPHCVDTGGKRVRLHDHRDHKTETSIRIGSATPARPPTA